MRLIGLIKTQEHAERFCDYLVTLNIENQVEENSGGAWEVWVHDDDDTDRGKTELAAFQANPDDPRYRVKSRAEALRQEEARRAQRLQKNYRDVRTNWPFAGTRRGTLSMTLILLSSMVVGINWSAGSREEGRSGFFAPDAMPSARWLMFRYDEKPFDVPLADRFDQVLKGQVWRVVTPIFLHFGILHFIFNMFWLRDLGGLLETRRGTGWLAVFVLVSAVLSNVGQAVVTGPYFGGMSGVVFALFGYTWMSGLLRPYEGIGVRKEIAVLMLAWLVLCFTGLLGPIANTAHLVGLLTGVGWVAIPHYLRRLRRA